MPSRPLLALSLAVLSVAGFLGLGAAEDAGASTPAHRIRTHVPEARCDAKGPANPAKTTAGRTGDPRARAAAQKGLGFLARASKQWQSGHACYGCHVHAVTLEALVVGKKHQYAVDGDALDSLIRGVTELPGGSRSKGGLSYHETSLLAPAKSFGGAAFAHYDQHVSSKLRDDLIQTARELLAFQTEQGELKADYPNWPVASTNIQFTYQAVQTWRQAFARTADDVWLPPIRRAESWLRQQAERLAKDGAAVTTQDLSYALLGLKEAQSGAADPLVARVKSALLERQAEDGSFAFRRGDVPGAFPTGQALYALRMAGLSDHDRAVQKGTAWLIAQQREDGGWSTAGSSKAEAMWGVLGLVSLDVVSVTVAGLEDGERVGGARRLKASARDNAGTGVVRTEIYVDDVRVASACGDTVSHELDPKAYEDGLHLVDAVAVNAEGKRSARRLGIYTGDVFLADLGTRYQDEGTRITARGLAQPSERGRVEVRIFEATTDESGAPARGREVRRLSSMNAHGPVDLRWDGKDKEGKAQRGRYLAEVRYLDEGGNVRQAVERPFVHEPPEVAKASFAEVEGQLQLGGAGAPAQAAANTKVELVDEKGNVVQSVLSTRSGQYRFKGVDAGRKYKVRVQKKGFAAREQEIETKAGEETKADAALEAR